MNNIGLIISGNLTGFSRFFATKNVNDLYKDLKIDFDYRNYLKFLNNEKKAYAISFSPSVIAVSIVTRILDSFRRPGVLVVSLLLPRRTKVEYVGTTSGQEAIYKLLNDINDKFYEKNFINGMINQNAAVLIQDYYSDIIANYALSSVSQRLINENIDMLTTNKKIGYIAASESLIPDYLSSICRRNYEGFHHVFFAQSAPTNIDEEPKEVVLYSVYCTNQKQTLNNVRLTDKIPQNCMPEEGEIDINKDFTYQQVLNGDAQQTIQAHIENLKIVLTYNFKKEEKTINFVFLENQTVIPISQIEPTFEYNNGPKGSIPIPPNGSYRFLGKEIYSTITITLGDKNYTIRQGGSGSLDIRRLKDGDPHNVYISKCIQIELNFSQFAIAKKIKITHRGATICDDTHKGKYFKIPLIDAPEECDCEISSPGYESIDENLATLLKVPVIVLKEKMITNTPIKNSIPGANTKTAKTDVHVSSTNTTAMVKLGGGGYVSLDNKHPKKKDKRIKHLVCGVLALVLVAGIYYINPLKFFEEDKGVAQVDPNDIDQKKETMFNICLLDASEDEITPSSNSLTEKYYNEFFKSLRIEANIGLIRETENPNPITKKLIYGDGDLKDSIMFSVKLLYDNDEIPLSGNEDNRFCVLDLIGNNKVNVKLDINTSELKVLYEVKDWSTDNITQEKINQWKKKLNARNEKFNNLLASKIGSIEHASFSDERESQKDSGTGQSGNGKKESEKSESSDKGNSDFKDFKEKFLLKFKKVSPEYYQSSKNKKILVNYDDWLTGYYNKRKDKKEHEIWTQGVTEQLKKCSSFEGLQSVIDSSKN